MRKWKGSVCLLAPYWAKRRRKWNDPVLVVHGSKQLKTGSPESTLMTGQTLLQNDFYGAIHSLVMEHLELNVKTSNSFK